MSMFWTSDPLTPSMARRRRDDRAWPFWFTAGVFGALIVVGLLT